MLPIVDEYSFCKLSVHPADDTPIIAIAREEPAKVHARQLEYLIVGYRTMEYQQERENIHYR